MFQKHDEIYIFQLHILLAIKIELELSIYNKKANKNIKSLN